MTTQETDLYPFAAAVERLREPGEEPLSSKEISRRINLQGLHITERKVRVILEGGTHRAKGEKRVEYQPGMIDAWFADVLAIKVLGLHPQSVWPVEWRRGQTLLTGGQ